MEQFGERLQRALGDRYRIERELGGGAMGMVYLARDLKLDRPVAIKVLRPEIAQSIGTDRFLQEIRIAARLAHPHVLSLIDSGEADGLLYYVMFYVSGESLRDRLARESRLDIDEAVRVTGQVADALDHAHREGIVHRDVKPGNILFEQGHALVCDFGVARALGQAGDEKLTRTGFAVGTPAYMSPEQSAGEDEVDHRADIYALASVLYEMLVGSPPFTGGSPQSVLARKLTGTPPSMRSARPEVPVHVEQAVSKALATDPDDRFETAGAFMEALTDPREAARATRSHRWARRARRVGVPAGIAAMVLAAGGAALLLSGGRGSAPLQVRATQVTAVPGLEDSPSISPDGQWLVYAGDDGPDRDIFLRSLAGERAINLTEDSPADDHAPSFSPDGEQIAFRSSRDGGGLFVMGVTGEAVRRVSDRGETPAWSPDGRSLVFAMEDVGLLPLNMEPIRPGLWRLDLETGEARRLVDADAILPSWSPDGRWIAYTSRTQESRSSIWVIAADGGEPRRLTDLGGNDWGGTWSADSRLLYFSSDRGGSMNLWRMPMDPDRGTARSEPRPIPTPSPFAAHPSVSRDGSRVLYTSAITTQNIERAALDPDADTLLEPFRLTTGSRQWSSPDPTPDGSRVAFYSRDLPEGDLYIVHGDGTGLRQLTGDSAIDRVPRWSPDGTRIAYFSNRSGPLQAWVIEADGSDNRRITRSDVVSTPGAWSPDGRRVVINTPPEAGYVLDLTDPPEERAPQPLAYDSAWGPFVANDWSPDGTRLAGMHGFADQGVGYYELATGEHVALTDYGQWPVWMPDGRRILFVSGGKAFYTVDVGTGDVDTVHAAVRDILGPPRITADGRHLFYSRRVTEGDIWMVTLGAPD